VSSIALPDDLGDLDDYVTPDLVVLPVEWEEADCWLADSEDAALIVEVVSPAEKSRDIRGKVDLYAVARVPVLFVVDPRNGTWALYTRPDNGAYRHVLPGKFGESVRLPEPLGVEVVTDCFPVYGSSPRPLWKMSTGRTTPEGAPFTNGVRDSAACCILQLTARTPSRTYRKGRSATIFLLAWEIQEASRISTTMTMNRAMSNTSTTKPSPVKGPAKDL